MNFCRYFSRLSVKNVELSFHIYLRPYDTCLHTGRTFYIHSTPMCSRNKWEPRANSWGNLPIEIVWTSSLDPYRIVFILFLFKIFPNGAALMVLSTEVRIFIRDSLFLVNHPKPSAFTKRKGISWLEIQTVTTFRKQVDICSNQKTHKELKKNALNGNMYSIQIGSFSFSCN